MEGNDDFDAINGLLMGTNKILQDLNSKYQRTLSDLSYLRNYTEKIMNQNMEDKLTSQISNLQTKNNAMFNRLKEDMISSDKDILRNMALRSEDYDMIRKTTKSRLSVYESRLDNLEQLIFEMKEQAENVPFDDSSQTTSTTQTTSFNDELLRKMSNSHGSNEYEDFAGKDFSMLGLSDPRDLDDLNTDLTTCPFPPCSIPLRSEKYSRVTDQNRYEWN